MSTRNEIKTLKMRERRDAPRHNNLPEPRPMMDTRLYRILEALAHRKMQIQAVSFPVIHTGHCAPADAPLFLIHLSMQWSVTTFILQLCLLEQCSQKLSTANPRQSTHVFLLSLGALSVRSVASLVTLSQCLWIWLAHDRCAVPRDLAVQDHHCCALIRAGSCRSLCACASTRSACPCP